MDPEQKKRQELEELVNLLGGIRGRHTELVTVMIPAETNIFTVVRQLEAERSTAENIKSKQTRNAVINSIEMIIRELKNYKQTPKNGLALFAGNVSEKEGSQDVQIWAIEPPKPLNVRIYRCDQVFVIDPLEEMLEVEEVYGLVVMDRKEATIGLLEGKHIKVIRHLTSGVPGKVRAGGQCLHPNTLVETSEGTKKISEINIGDQIKALDIPNAKVIFTKCTNKWDQNKESNIEITTNNNKSIISSDEHLFFIYDNNKLIEVQANWILKGARLINDIKKTEIVKKLVKKQDKINLIDIETECGNFFANNLLVHNSSQRFERITEGLAKEFFRRVAGSMKEIFFDMPKLKGILIGGPVPTKEEFLKEGELVTKLKNLVIAIKDLGDTDEHGLELLVELSDKEISQQEKVKEVKIITKFFETLGKHKEKAVYGIEKTKLALERGAVEILLISKKLQKSEAQELEKLAENIGSEVHVISTENADGLQFYNLTKGVGAILRFQIE